jgi:hypothetical protein
VLIMNKSDRYYSFLLRVWSEPDEEHNYQFQLENIQTSEKSSYRNLEEFMTYLRQAVAPLHDSPIKKN